MHPSEGWKGKYHKCHQRPFVLQLLPDQYISLGDNNLPNKGKVHVNSLDGGDFSDPLELRLSLSLGVAKRKKEDQQRSWYNNTCSGVVIDLEESTKKTSREDAKRPPLDFAAKVTYFEEKHDLQVTITSDPITSRSTKKDLSHEITESKSFVGDSKCCQD